MLIKELFVQNKSVVDFKSAQAIRERNVRLQIGSPLWRCPRGLFDKKVEEINKELVLRGLEPLNYEEVDDWDQANLLYNRPKDSHDLFKKVLNVIQKRISGIS